MHKLTTIEQKRIKITANQMNSQKRLLETERLPLMLSNFGFLETLALCDGRITSVTFKVPG